jgi:hypothetical protein
MLAHYVEVHHYRPPNEFVAALLQSPLPGTDEYWTVTEPFRRLFMQRRATTSQSVPKRYLENAGLWAFGHGGTEEWVSEAASRFFGERSLETCADIRRVMPNEERVATPEMEKRCSLLQEIYG